jgi:acetolactate synthase I/II/III large subunit
MLQASKRPLIYAGGGVINGDAHRRAARFAERFGIPVVTTLMGIGAVDTTQPAVAAHAGHARLAFANYAVEDCDFLIAVGARFDDRVAACPRRSSRPRPHRPVRHRRLGDRQGQAVDWSTSATPSGLRKLTTTTARHRLPSRISAPGTRELAELKDTYRLNYDRDSDVDPALCYVIEAINEITGGEAIISTGVGQHQMWAAQYFDFKHPRLWLTSGSMGTMGFGLPAAIGAQFAAPGSW